MKYLAAYVLSTMGGNDSPTAKDIEKILGSVGLDVDMEEANKVVSALSGKFMRDLNVMDDEIASLDGSLKLS
ncbi:unnamed protein product [Enterobius vermicularis]|uniref:Large ribosomal subunit protein P2 n=1 Tax=Enterobius vermicularis TaxID=51028 RepID=A0A0N4V308_ENTVE|nr:unnamed protein product [Enterobius vermicularis]